MVLLTLTAILSYVSKEMFGTSQPIKWSPIAYGHLFFVGVATFYLRERFKSVTSKSPIVLIAVAVASIVAALAIEFSGRSEILALSTAILILYVSPARARWVTRPLTTPLMLFLGSISYSIYLIHILVFHILSDVAMLPTSSIGKFLVVFGITVALSTATYMIIEKPTNQAGRRMVS